MALKNLSTERMLHVSTAWVDDKADRKLLEGIPLLSALLPVIDATHEELLRVNVGTGPGPVAQALKAVSDKSDTVDTQHDRKARGVFWYLSARGELSDDADQTRQFLDTRDALLPHGLSITNWSYSEEAGNIAVVKKVLTPAMRTFLKTLKTQPGQTADDEVAAWVSAGEALGKLERQRVDLEAQTDPTVISRADAVRARNAWIKMVNAVTSNLGLVVNLDPKTETTLLGSLREAEQEADRKVAAKKAADAPAAGETPTTTTTPVAASTTPAAATTPAASTAGATVPVTTTHSATTKAEPAAKSDPTASTEKPAS